MSPFKEFNSFLSTELFATAQNSLLRLKMPKIRDVCYVSQRTSTHFLTWNRALWYPGVMGRPA